MQTNHENEDEPGKNVARVEFVLVSPILLPEDATAMIGLRPTRSFKKGDMTDRPDARTPRPWGLWAYEVEAEDVETAAKALLAAVEGRLQSIRRAAESAQARVSVSIWWEPDGGQGGFSLPAELMRRLCALGDRIDIYIPG